MTNRNEALPVVTVPPELVDELNRNHQEAATLFQRGTVLALRNGEILLGIRKLFPARAAEGEGFEVWVDTNTSFTGKTARNYIRLHKHRHLIDPEDTITNNLRMLASPKPATGAGDPVTVTIPETDFRNGDPGPDPTEAVSMTWTEATEDLKLAPKDEAKALELAAFFGVDANKARSWVQSRKKQPAATNKRAADPNKLRAVTVRFEPEEVDMMEKVARRESKRLGKLVSLAEVAREHHKLGAARFAKKYGITKDMKR